MHVDIQCYITLHDDIPTLWCIHPMSLLIQIIRLAHTADLPFIMALMSAFNTFSS